MHRAWVALLLAGCGFSSDKNNGMDHDVPDAAVVDALAIENHCWTIDDGTYDVHWMKCTSAIAPELRITKDRIVDTSDTAQCAVLSANGKGEEVCALIAKQIILEDGATLRGTGKRALALFGTSIELRGRIDVASHIGGTSGAGASDDGCNPLKAAGISGGGAGGTFEGTGGNGGQDGGNAGNTVATAGLAGGSITDKLLRSGCPGRRGATKLASSSPRELGGAGGGAVWIAATDTLTLAATAVINASGAGGLGGAGENQGGDGGGAGGFIVLQAPALSFALGAQVFANGGDGGAGAIGMVAGANGADPVAPMGSNATTPSDTAGAGGFGYPRVHAGENGKDGGGGGGGGGGGLGAIRIVSQTSIPAANTSPPAQRWSAR